MPVHVHELESLRNELMFLQGNKAAWSRGGQGFIAISNEGEWSGTFQTGMPAGQYCNVIQGCATSSGCVGDTITVNSDGSVSITVPSGDEPMIAIHGGSQIDKHKT